MYFSGAQLNKSLSCFLVCDRVILYGKFHLDVFVMNINLDERTYMSMNYNAIF